MRTNQKERAENARKFYSIFMDGNCDKAAIVVNRIESSNPNINRCQFVAVPSPSLISGNISCTPQKSPRVISDKRLLPFALHS